MLIQPRSSKRFVLLSIALAVGGASLIAVGQPTAPDRASATRPDADFDGDGVINALDNCLVAPNADQRDSDRDGIGNACDADFNNDGIVDEQDLVALTLAFGTSARDKDLNGDGAVDNKDLQILLQLFKRAPGPRLDSDADNVADLEDPCPQASAGVPSTVPGCTALGLLQQPGAVFGPLTTKIMRIVVELRGASEMVEIQTDLEATNDAIVAAERMVRHGDPCSSSRLFERGDELLAAALSAIERQLADARVAVRGRAAPVGRGLAGIVAVDTAGDVSEGDMLVVGLEYWWEQVGSVRTLNRLGAEAYAGVCAAATVGTANGVIRALLDAKRQIVLTDRRTFGLAEPISLTGDVFEGRAVQLSGLMFGDGSGYVTGLGPEGPAADVPPATFVQCLHLRFAPVQRFPPFFSGPFVLHDPLGYRVDIVYKVEAGMGVAAKSTCSAAHGGQSFPRYSLKVELSYQQKNTAASIDHALMAAELTASDDPVLFSSDIDPDAPATLHVTSEVRSCSQLNDLQCGDPTVIDMKDYPLAVRGKGALAFALYDQVEFDVNDQKSGDFRLTFVSFFAALPGADDGTSPTFVAEGYGPFFDGIIQTPIINGDPFAIRSNDFFPIFPAFTLAQAYGELLAASLAGVDHPAGLRWPHVEGKRNGADFWYSAALPAIVRDVVNFCASPHAYYRLPFAHGDLSWSQGQGNHPELPPGTPGYTHSGGYAYDMIAPLNTPIRAARAGRVVKLDESHAVQCNPGDGCPPNNIFIRHQDGSIGEYVHMPMNSVLPDVGDAVQRGELLAVVGVVGPSTGPHLHFATRTQPKPGGVTFLAKFEVLVWFVVNPELSLPCYVPIEGDPLRSNNIPIP